MCIDQSLMEAWYIMTNGIDNLMEVDCYQVYTACDQFESRIFGNMETIPLKKIDCVPTSKI